MKSANLLLKFLLELAALASFGGAVLVWTGLSLAWRRLIGWIGRKKRSTGERTRSAEEAA